MNHAELMERIRNETIKQVSIQHQFEATFKLYDAACMVDNRVLLEQYRDQLHSLLDIKLDTTNGLMELTRRMIRLSGQ